MLESITYLHTSLTISMYICTFNETNLIKFSLVKPNFKKCHSIFHSREVYQAVVQIMKVLLVKHVWQHWCIVMWGWYTCVWNTKQDRRRVHWKNKNWNSLSLYERKTDHDKGENQYHTDHYPKGYGAVHVNPWQLYQESPLASGFLWLTENGKPQDVP